MAELIFGRQFHIAIGLDLKKHLNPKHKRFDGMKVDDLGVHLTDLKLGSYQGALYQ